MPSTSHKNYRYQLVDVFTEEQFQGNQLAVFPDARGLDNTTMQRIAREFNLPEVTFVFPVSLAGCVADVRIFTPLKEMMFAGHPTIGTAYVLRSEGLVASSAEEFTLQVKVGPVPVRVDKEGGGILWLKTPPIHWGRTYDPAVCARVLGLNPGDLDAASPPQKLSAGNPTLLVALRSPEIVDRAWLGLDGMQRLRGDDSELFCVFIFAATKTGAYSRMFAPEYGIAEDPASGSATGPLGAFMKKHRLASNARFVSEQGAKMGRRSLLHVHVHGPDDIDVGGHVISVGEGNIRVLGD
jgi:trans-2,3-dihydro-3-hydroxyanthranilate isomerase